jgi:hypothetical protein
VSATLDEFAEVATTASQLAAHLNLEIGNIASNPSLDAYSRLDPAHFNDEYREFQRSVEIITKTASTLRSESQVKKVQFGACPATEYPRLLRTWMSDSTGEMDELVDLMR